MNINDETIPPRREMGGMDFDNEQTMPGKRDRKPDGRFVPGDLILNRYRVISELGQGGMGVVYQCLDETAGIEVALKALPPELSHNTLEMEDIRENFQLVAGLIHQNIAVSRNLEKDNSSGNYYLIMERVEGEDLRRWIKRKRKEGSLTLDAVLPIIRQVADALDYAHRQKVIHRDIKPGNIMIAPDGTVKVLDFGLAAQIHTSMTRVSMAYHGTSGTGPYMAPEQWRGRAQGANADQYALAVMAYEMLAGHLPFESADAAVLREAVLNDTAEELNEIPRYAQEALKRAMSKEPAERFESCSAFVEALGGKKVSAKVRKSTNSRKWKIAVGGLVLLLIAVVVLAALFLQSRPAAPARQVAKPEPVVVKPSAEEVAVNRYNSEKKLAAQIQETYRLQSRLQLKKSRIDAAKYDRGQSFGKYLDALAESFGAGELAMKNNDVSSANASFTEAEQAAEWIIKNAPLRRNAEALFASIEEQKKAVEQFNGFKLAYASCQKAAEAVDRAKQQYEAGNFEAAIRALEQGAMSYKTACSEAREAMLKNLIEEAEQAKSRNDWNSVREYSEKIRPLDEAKANELSTYANAQLKAEAVKKTLAEARAARAAKQWKKVLELAQAALKLEENNSEAGTLMSEAGRQLKIARENELFRQKIEQGRMAGFQFSNDGKTLEKAPRNLTTYSIPQGVTTIAAQAFYRCYSLTGITIPDSVTTIEETAIFLCKSPKIKISPGNRNFMVDSAGALIDRKNHVLLFFPPSFSGKYVIPSDVTTIGAKAFYECGSLSGISIPGSVTTIGEYAFLLCKSLTSITIPDSVTTIGKLTFYGCESLTSVTIPDSVTTIGELAFYGCKSLTGVTIPDSVTTIGESAFYGCRSLKTARVPQRFKNDFNSIFEQRSNLKITWY